MSGTYYTVRFYQERAVKIWFVAVIFLFGSAVYGESPLVDPQIPNGESLRFRIIEDDEISYSTQEIFQEDTSFGRIYSIFNKSDSQDSHLVFNCVS